MLLHILVIFEIDSARVNHEFETCTFRLNPKILFYNNIKRWIIIPPCDQWCNHSLHNNEWCSKTTFVLNVRGKYLITWAHSSDGKLSQLSDNIASFNMSFPWFYHLDIHIHFYKNLNVKHLLSHWWPSSHTNDIQRKNFLHCTQCEPIRRTWGTYMVGRLCQNSTQRSRFDWNISKCNFNMSQYNWNRSGYNLNQSHYRELVAM